MRFDGAAGEVAIDVGGKRRDRLIPRRRILRLRLLRDREHRRRAGGNPGEHRAEREHVRPVIDRCIAARLLGRHVVGRADDRIAARRSTIRIPAFESLRPS